MALGLSPGDHADDLRGYPPVYAFPLEKVAVTLGVDPDQARSIQGALWDNWPTADGA
jgi:hypothetical protein